MDYRVASNIRSKSLSSLMTENIVSGKSIGSALSGAVSSKLKAKVTGVKEKFDPMNIAKFMTGGSRLAPAILGKLTGRSQADISYFAGDKNRKNTYTQISSQMAAPDENLGGSAVEVLNKMFSFLQNSREEDKKRKDTAKQFMEEQKVEEQRRHNEFLNILKEYTSLGTTTTLVDKKTDAGGGIFDFIKNYVSGFFYNFFKKGPLKWLLDNKKLLLSIFRVFTGPFGVALLGGTIILWLASKLKEYAETVPNMEVIGPTEAANILKTGTQKDIDKAGGEEYLRDIIENAPKRATEILERQDIKEIAQAGGFEKLKEIEKDIIEQPEKRDAMLAMPEYVPPKKEFIKNARGTKKANEEKWDREFGPYYNPETGKRLERSKKLTEVTQADVRRVDNALEESGVTPTQADVRRVDNALEESGVTPTQADARRVDNALEESGVTPTFPAAQTATPLPADVTPSTAGGGRGSLNPPMVDPTKPMVTPVPQTPMSNRMNDVVSENQDLNLSSYNMATQSSSAPVVTTNTNSVDLPDKPIPATATVRDTTPILDYVLKQYAVPV